MPQEINVLVADDDQMFCRTLAELLRCHRDLRLCGLACDGLQALEMIDKWRPDVVLLDVIMPHLDGLGVLEKLANVSFHPAVLIINPFGQETMTRHAVALGADYYPLRPLNLSLLLGRIRTLAGKPGLGSKGDLFLCTSRLIQQMGIYPSLYGYRYLRDAILSVLEDGVSTSGGMVRELYPRIATKYLVAPGRVERCIRSAIEIAWKKGSEKNWHKFFRYNHIMRAKPTNAEFISTMAELVRIS